jgi:hypothetical protein
MIEFEDGADYARLFLAHGKSRLQDEDKIERWFRRTIRRHWGAALDAYRLVVAAVMDLHVDLSETCSAEAATRNCYLFEALSRLETRAIQVGREVHHSLTGGNVDGAYGRCRTLHEVAVIAQVLAEYGRDPAYPDLAERFLLHDIAHNARDANVYQDHFQDLGWEPIPSETLLEIDEARDQLIARFGDGYASLHGWAIGLPGMEKSANENGLYRLTDLQRFHPLHRWAGHLIHADAKSAALTVIELAEGVRLAAAPTTSGLNGPASWALNSLFHCTQSYALHAPPPPSPGMICTSYNDWLDGIDRLIDHAERAFETGNDAEQRAVARNFTKQRHTERDPAGKRHATPG